jgi:hypothetical protein
MKLTRIAVLFLTLMIPFTVFAQNSRSTRHRPRTIEGTIIGRRDGMAWYGIVVESSGRRYMVTIANNPNNRVRDPVVVGDVESVGARVRVTYIGSEPWSDNMLALYATRIVRLNNRTATPNRPLQRGVYYIKVARCNAGQFSRSQWQQTANRLRRGGIPVFFALTESLPLSRQIRGEWLLIRITRRYSTAHVDALILGPFSSKQAASAAVARMPSLLPEEGRPLVEEHSGAWGMGCFIIMGTRTPEA